MNIKRPLVSAIALSLGVIGLLLMWPVSRNPASGLSVTFVALSNDSSGILSAQFSVSNRCSRGVRFGVCDVQHRQTGGWPGSMRVTGGAAWLPVAAGGERVFSVPAPLRAGTNWRVPLMYQEDLSFFDNVRLRVDLIAWGISHWLPGKPVPVRHGDSFHRTLFTYGPEVPGEP